jgi:hypothetical protein
MEAVLDEREAERRLVWAVGRMPGMAGVAVPSPTVRERKRPPKKFFTFSLDSSADLWYNARQNWEGS